MQDESDRAAVVLGQRNVYRKHKLFPTTISHRKIQFLQQLSQETLPDWRNFAAADFQERFSLIGFSPLDEFKTDESNIKVTKLSHYRTVPLPFLSQENSKSFSITNFATRIVQSELIHDLWFISRCQKKASLDPTTSEIKTGYGDIFTLAETYDRIVDRAEIKDYPSHDHSSVPR